MTSRLITRRPDGSVIVDSDQICLGLVKSGYMQPMGQWQRTRRQAANNQNYIPLVDGYDSLYGFTVKAIAPIVFISGRAALAASFRDGDMVTFYYGAASSSTKYYVYDLMSDRGPGAKLRMWRDDRTPTFDSEQLPLNIYTSITPPGPSAQSAQHGGFGYAYAGGNITAEGRGGLYTTAFSSWSTALPEGQYAVNLPWRRGCFHCERDAWRMSFAATEGVYSSGRNIVFFFSTAPGTPVNDYYQTSFPLNTPTTTFFNIPTARIPKATVIEVSKIPFPFDANL